MRVLDALGSGAANCAFWLCFDFVLVALGRLAWLKGDEIRRRR